MLTRYPFLESLHGDAEYITLRAAGRAALEGLPGLTRVDMTVAEIRALRRPEISPRSRTPSSR
jgi:hypothetical protein